MDVFGNVIRNEKLIRARHERDLARERVADLARQLDAALVDLKIASLQLADAERALAKARTEVTALEAAARTQNARILELARGGAGRRCGVTCPSTATGAGKDCGGCDRPEGHKGPHVCEGGAVYEVVTARTPAAQERVS